MSRQITVLVLVLLSLGLALQLSSVSLFHAPAFTQNNLIILRGMD